MHLVLHRGRSAILNKRTSDYVVCTYVLCSRDICTLADIRTVRTPAAPPRISCRWQGPLQQESRHTQDQDHQTSPSIGRVAGSAFFVPCRPIESGAEPAEPTIDAPTPYFVTYIRRDAAPRDQLPQHYGRSESDDEEGEDVKSG
jgi:hypothetical protein